MGRPRVGGYPADARPAGAVPGSELKPSRLAPEGARVQNGGVPFEGDGYGCPRTTLKGEPCKSKPSPTGLCHSHQKQADNES